MTVAEFILCARLNPLHRIRQREVDRVPCMVHNTSRGNDVELSWPCLFTHQFLKARRLQRQQPSFADTAA